MYIQVKGLSKTYGRQKVLNNIDVAFEQGKIHGLTGRNGSGKTQLFKAICGYVLPDAGEVWVQGKQIGKQADYPPSLGMLIEHPGFLPNYSGLFNLEMLAAMNTRLGKQELIACMVQVGLRDSANKKVSQYSLGMRQRLGLAQALMGNPDLLILDEPFNGLDKSGVEEIRALLLSLKKEGRTILLASHNPYDIEALCDTIHEMEAGDIKEILVS